MSSNEGAKVVKVSVDELTEFFNTTAHSDSQMFRRIESLSVSADAKALLADLLKVTTRVGDALLRVGRKILDFVLALLQQFPHLGFAVLIALVVGAIFTMLPIVGTALGAVLTPLALALGVTWGAKVEMESGDLGDRVREFAARFSVLAA